MSVRGQLTVKIWALLVPQLEQPRSPVLPAGVCTTTLKLPAPGIMEDVTLAVSWELLINAGGEGRAIEDHYGVGNELLPVAVMTKLGGSCEKTIVVGEIELRRLGKGRVLPQSGFSALHPGSSKTMISHELS